METFIEFCKNFIIDHIDDYDGVRERDEIGDLLTDGMNCDGTFTYSASKAREYISAWQEEAGDYFDYEKREYGEIIHNPFSEPEAYLVCMLIRGVNSVLWSCDFIMEEEPINLDEEKARELIKEQVRNVSNIHLF